MDASIRQKYLSPMWTFVGDPETSSESAHQEDRESVLISFFLITPGSEIEIKYFYTSSCRNDDFSNRSRSARVTTPSDDRYHENWTNVIYNITETKVRYNPLYKGDETEITMVQWGRVNTPNFREACKWPLHYLVSFTRARP